MRAALMDEREWRRALWRYEIGSKIASGITIALAGALAARFIYAVEHEGLLHWAWRLTVEVALLIPAAIVAYLWSPSDWSQGPWAGDERPEYRAAKVARDRFEKDRWKAAGSRRRT